MAYLRVTANDALKRIQQIPHKNCYRAIPNCWKVNENGDVQQESVLWLFCWAATGQESKDARDAAHRVFNEVFTHNCFEGKGTFFDWFNLRVSLEYARKNRYSTVWKDGLDALLCNTQDEAK